MLPALLFASLNARSKEVATVKRICLFILLVTFSTVFFSCDTVNGFIENITGKETDNSDSTGAPDTDGEVDLSNIKFLDLTTDYNGVVKRMAVRGKLPKGVTVEYEGNDKTDAGVYTVTAKFYKNGVYLEGKDMTATLTINKGKYDMSGTRFPRATFDYTGEVYTPSISGIIPTGVTVEFVCDREIRNAGSYTVTAKFSGDTKNYDPIPDMLSIYTVNKAVRELNGISFGVSMFEYDGEPHSIFIEGDLPDWVEVEYVGNGAVMLGEHSVQAIFISTDPNYLDPAPLISSIIILPDKVDAVELIYELTATGTYEVVGCIGGNSQLIVPSFYNGRMVTSIKSSAFMGNDTITSALISSNVTNIGNKAFMDCSSLESVTLSDSLEVIGYGAFAGTAITEIVLPDSLVSIGQGAFMNTELERMTLPFVGGSRRSSNAYLGYVFGATSYTGNAALIPDTLHSVTLTDSADRIPAFAFYGVGSLKEITLGSKVAFIGNSAFAGTSLKSIYLPASVIEIPADADAENSPFFGLDGLYIVLGGSLPYGFGRWWNGVATNRTATVEYNKTYDEYLEIIDGLQ